MPKTPNTPTIGIACITYNARHHLPHVLPPYLNSPLQPRVVVVNSSSQDGTVEAAEALGAETFVVPRHTFNHGRTRELARHHLGTDIVVMITPDAYPIDNFVLEKLVAPLIENKASVSYARQIPHKGAGLFECFAREYNYPEKSHIRSLQDLPTFGAYTFFCSNACAAYQNSALEQIGGFSPVLLGEDTVAVAKLLKKGHAIAYTADAVVQHSHSYTLKQEFQRYFDTGLARNGYRELIATSGEDHRRGTAYTQALLKKVWKEFPQKLPYAAAQTAAKWFGYQLGCWSTNAPRSWKKFFSSQDFYWL